MSTQSVGCVVGPGDTTLDEIELFVVPTVVGGGKPFCAPDRRLDLTLEEHRVFPSSGWMYVRYSVSR
ncbi:hypothetical protein [Williamsia sp. 1135]|uniref:hypothetical protein n=1 Tax=Williamsia sp. 1135 TaxID=1889262 RepID=UPI000A116B5F|nr:hypothetical protein [Williamsia sp. 1135]ORM32787.1 hypothetical protein BFL43_14815 [Williamsia sp. 1135]